MSINLRLVTALPIIVLLSAGELIRAADTETATLQILVTTDTHGRFLPCDYSRNQTNDTGSMAQAATLIYLLRAAHLHNTIVVDDGDFAQGNFQDLFVNAANPMMVAMNEIGYDVVTLGNHEFNYGIPALLGLAKQFHDPARVLCGNVYASDGRRLFPLCTVVTTGQGIAVGFIGTVSPNITRWDAAHLQDYRVTGPVDETREAIRELRRRVDILVALTHMDLPNEYDLSGSGALDLAAACPELDVIICGHGHRDIPGDYYFEGTNVTGAAITEGIRRNGILLIESRKWADAVGQVLITMTRQENGSWRLADRALDLQSTNILIKTETRTIAPDPDLVARLAPYHRQALERAERVIGELEGGPLVPPDEINGLYAARLRPTPLIALINDVQRYYGRRLLKDRPVDAALTTAFVDQANIQPGPIRYADVALIYPYDNALYLVEMTGRQLRQFLEWNAAYYNTWQPGDLTLSFNPERWGYSYNMPGGIRYAIELLQPVGARIRQLSREEGTPIQDDDRLVVAVNNHLANTLLLTPGPVFAPGDPLPELLARSDEEETMNAATIRELIVDYIEHVKQGRITAECPENWTLTGTDWDPMQRATAVALINAGQIPVMAPDAAVPFTRPVTVSQLKALGLFADPAPPPGSPVPENPPDSPSAP